MTPGFWLYRLEKKAGCSALLWKRSIQRTDGQAEVREGLFPVGRLLWSLPCLSADQRHIIAVFGKTHAGPSLQENRGKDLQGCGSEQSEG